MAEAADRKQPEHVTDSKVCTSGSNDFLKPLNIFWDWHDRVDTYTPTFNLHDEIGGIKYYIAQQLKRDWHYIIAGATTSLHPYLQEIGASDIRKGKHQFYKRHIDFEYNRLVKDRYPMQVQQKALLTRVLRDFDAAEHKVDARWFACAKILAKVKKKGFWDKEQLPKKVCSKYLNRYIKVQGCGKYKVVPARPPTPTPDIHDSDSHKVGEESDGDIRVRRRRSPSHPLYDPPIRLGNSATCVGRLYQLVGGRPARVRGSLEQVRNLSDGLPEQYQVQKEEMDETGILASPGYETILPHLEQSLFSDCPPLDYGVIEHILSKTPRNILRMKRYTRDDLKANDYDPHTDTDKVSAHGFFYHMKFNPTASACMLGRLRTRTKLQSMQCEMSDNLLYEHYKSAFSTDDLIHSNIDSYHTVVGGRAKYQERKPGETITARAIVAPCIRGCMATAPMAQLMQNLVDQSAPYCRIDVGNKSYAREMCSGWGYPKEPVIGMDWKSMGYNLPGIILAVAVLIIRSHFPLGDDFDFYFARLMFHIIYKYVILPTGHVIRTTKGNNSGPFTSLIDSVANIVMTNFLLTYTPMMYKQVRMYGDDGAVRLQVREGSPPGTTFSSGMAEVMTKVPREARKVFGMRLKQFSQGYLATVSPAVPKCSYLSRQYPYLAPTRTFRDWYRISAFPEKARRTYTSQSARVFYLSQSEPGGFKDTYFYRYFQALYSSREPSDSEMDQYLNAIQTDLNNAYINFIKYQMTYNNHHGPGLVMVMKRRVPVLSTATLNCPDQALWQGPDRRRGIWMLRYNYLSKRDPLMSLPFTSQAGW